MMTHRNTLAILSFAFITALLASDAAAMYAPRVGRFMQRDPLGFTDGMNQYEYVASDPVGHVDPSGLISQDASTFCDANCRGASNYSECYRQCIKAVLEDQRPPLPIEVPPYDTAPDAGFLDWSGSPWGTTFSTDLDAITEDIRQRLKKNGKCCIESIIIGGHGGVPGSFSLGQSDHPSGQPQDNLLTGEQLENYNNNEGFTDIAGAGNIIEFLDALAPLMCDESEIRFHVCDSGAGTKGKKFRRELERFFADRGKDVDIDLPTTGCRWWNGRSLNDLGKKEKLREAIPNPSRPRPNDNPYLLHPN